PSDFLSLAFAAMDAAETIHGRTNVIVCGSEDDDGHPLLAADQTFLGFQSRHYAPGAPMYTISMIATVFPRALFDRVRFDEQLVSGYEESDLATRAVAAGMTIVPCLEACVYHRPSEAARAAARVDYHSFAEASRLYATFKRYYWTERRLARAAAFAV